VQTKRVSSRKKTTPRRHASKAGRKPVAKKAKVRAGSLQGLQAEARDIAGWMRQTQKVMAAVKPRTILIRRYAWVPNGPGCTRMTGNYCGKAPETLDVYASDIALLLAALTRRISKVAIGLGRLSGKGK
jgi:hypothetical protein